MSLTAEQLAAFAAGVKQMLEDVQERLVYRTHIYIQTDIVNYKPAPGDLAYPDKLEMMEVKGSIYEFSPTTLGLMVEKKSRLDFGSDLTTTKKANTSTDILFI